MNGIYIHPPKLPIHIKHDWNEIYSGYLIMPMGIIGLANLLKEKNINICGLNYPLEVYLDKKFNFVKWLENKFDVKFILMDLHWYEHSFGAMQIAKICKEIYPDVPIIIGGFTASLFSEAILAGFPDIDFVIRGDAEQPLLELIQQIQKKELYPERIPNLSYRLNSHPVENELSYCANSDMLDKLDFVDLDFLQNYQLYNEFQSTESPHLTCHWLCVGRGCIYDCCHCGGGKTLHESKFQRKRMVLRSLEAVVKDMIRLQEMGIDQVGYSYDPACISRKYWTELFTLMAENNINMGFHTELNQIPSQSFLERLAEVAFIPHSQLAFSPLSGSEKVRRFNGKFFSNQQLFERLVVCKKLSIPIFIYFSLNLPLENEDTFKETLKMAKDIYDFYPLHLLKMSALCHNLDPYSPMYLSPAKYQIKSHFKSFSDYYKYCQLPPALSSDKEIKKKRGYSSSHSNSSLFKICQQWREFCVGKELNCVAFH